MDYVGVFLDYYNIWGSIILMMMGFYAVILKKNLIKKLMGLSIFQVSVLLLYVSAGYKDNGLIPIFVAGTNEYVNPLPHVLMLTAIVVGVAVMAVGLAIVVRINEQYGAIEEDRVMVEDKFNDNEFLKIENQKARF